MSRPKNDQQNISTLSYLLRKRIYSYMLIVLSVILVLITSLVTYTVFLIPFRSRIMIRECQNSVPDPHHKCKKLFKKSFFFVWPQAFFILCIFIGSVVSTRNWHLKHWQLGIYTRNWLLTLATGI